MGNKRDKWFRNPFTWLFIVVIIMFSVLIYINNMDVTSWGA